MNVVYSTVQDHWCSPVSTPNEITIPDPHAHPTQPGEAWYVVHSQPVKEYYAACQLQQTLRLAVFLPEVRRYFRNALRNAPLFPRYLFVKADLEQTAPRLIQRTPGVSQLVRMEDRPLPVPVDVLRELYQRIEQMNACGGLVEHAFTAGDRVRIASGPLRGIDAIFAGSTTARKRVQILFELLGRENRAEVDLWALEPLDDRAPTQRGRRLTRGKGRRINSAR